MAIVKRLLIVGTSMVVAAGVYAATQDAVNNNDVIQRIAKELQGSSSASASSATSRGQAGNQSSSSQSGQTHSSNAASGSGGSAASAGFNGGASAGGSNAGSSANSGTSANSNSNANANSSSGSSSSDSSFAAGGSQTTGASGAATGSASSASSTAAGAFGPSSASNGQNSFFNIGGQSGSAGNGAGGAANAWAGGASGNGQGSFGQGGVASEGSSTQGWGAGHGAGQGGFAQGGASAQGGNQSAAQGGYAPGSAGQANGAQGQFAQAGGSSQSSGVGSGAAQGAYDSSNVWGQASSNGMGQQAAGQVDSGQQLAFQQGTAMPATGSAASGYQSGGNAGAAGSMNAAMANGNDASQATPLRSSHPGFQGGNAQQGRIAETFGDLGMQAAVATYRPVISQDQDTINQLAFKQLLQRQMPMTPEQVVRLHSMYNQSQKAASTYPGIPPRPVSKSIQTSLAPGSAQPVILLEAGFVSGLLFVDSTGAPWPVQAYDLGDPKDFDVQWDKKSNLLMVQAKRNYKYANIAVSLQGLSTPVMLMLAPATDQFYYRADIRVPGLGPKPKALPVNNGLPGTANPALMSLLDGVPPAQAHFISVEGGRAQAWMSYGHLFIRTRLTILSPGWIGKMSSADGMNAYELQAVSTILAKMNGHLVHLKLKGF